MISSTNRKAGPFAGNGVTTVFPFTFKVFSASDVQVVATTSNVDTVLAVGFVVALNSDQNVSPGGTVTFTVAPATGTKITLLSVVASTQSVELTNGGGFFPAVLNDAFDRETILAQQLEEKMGRALVVSPSAVNPDTTLPASIPGQALGQDASGNWIGIPASGLDTTTAAANSAAAALADRQLADADRVQTGLDRVQTGLDRAQTGLDRVQTGLDRVQTGLDVSSAALAAAAAGAYPVTANVGGNVPRGLTQASVGAITAGSGGANGTFNAAFSGGNFAVNPTATFTVAGGVLTAFTITGPGLYIGAAPTVPTVSFAASAGLTGAAVALTAQFLVANGVGYWAASTDGAQLERVTNIAGVVTAVAGVNPISLLNVTTAIAAERSARFLAAYKDAIRDPSACKLLLTKDGAKTYKAGSTTEIDEIAGLIGGPATNVGYVTWSGGGGAAPNFPLRPIETATGLQFTRETGFVVTTGLFANNNNFTMDMVLRFPAVAATFASVALMNAAVATYKVGEIVQVTGGPNTNLGNDIPNASYAMSDIPQGNQVSGYYIKGNTTFGPLAPIPFMSWYDSAYAGASRYQRLFIDNRGQLLLAGYDGTNQPFLRTIAENIFVMGQTAPVQIRVDADATQCRLWLNGDEVDAHFVVGSFTPTHLYINGTFGRATGAGTSAVAVGGQSFTLDCLSITQGLEYVTRKDVSNVIARTFGTPIQKYSETAYLIVHIDQSRTATSGPSTAGDPLRPDPVTLWNGELSKEAPGSGLLISPTQERIKGVFTFASSIASDKIGPLAAYANQFAVASGRYTLSGTGGETHEFGMAKQLKLAETIRNSDLYMVATTYGGYSLDNIKLKSTPPTYLYDLLSKSAAGPTAGMQAREQLLRAVASVAKRCRAQGQRLRVLAITHLQGETTVTASGYTSATMGTAYYDDITDLWNNDLKYLVDASGPTPVMIKKQMGWAGDGVSNSYITAANDYRDDQLRRLEALRSNAFRYSVFGGYANRFGRWIHPIVLDQRALGEGLGDQIRREYFEETSDTRAAQVLTWVRSGSNLIGTCNVPLQQINSKPPYFPGIHTTGGFNDLGVVFEPNASSPGRTINGNVTWANSGPGGVGVITVPISGGGPIAGDRVNITGTNVYYTNLYSATTRTGLFTSMNWPAFPLTGLSNPAIDPTGPLNDLTEPLAASSHVVT